MSNYKYDKEQLLERTDGGLLVFQRLLSKCTSPSGKFINFSLPWQNDDNPSSCIAPRKFWKNNTAFIKSFNASETYDCFSLLKQMKGLTFGEACKWIADNFGVSGNTYTPAKFESKLADEGAVVGLVYFDYKSKLTADELKVLGPLVSNNLCKDYNVKSCNSYTRIVKYEKDAKKASKQKMFKQFGENPVAMTIKSSENFPIFTIDEGHFQKILQPKNPDKKWRFSYAGEKATDFIFGLSQLENLLEIEKSEKAQSFVEDFIDEYGKPPTDKQVEDYKQKVKLPKLIIASGDRDALNVASLNYPVVWFNSESAPINAYTLSILKKYAHKIYLLPDIDAPGKAFAVEKAIKNIDLYVIWLHDSLLEKKDWRNNPKKDFRDWIEMVANPDKPELVQNEFDKMVNNAMKLRWWTSWKTDKGEIKYDINDEALEQFLWYYGFRKNEDESDIEDMKLGYEFVQIKENKIHKVLKHHIKNFPLIYLRSRNEAISLRNFIKRSPQIKSEKFDALPTFNTDIKYAGKDYQYFFFKNQVWKVLPDKIEQYTYKNCEVLVYEKNVLEHDAYVMQEKPFEIFKNERDVWDIKIKDKNNDYLNFLINGSRIHWREKGFYPYHRRKIPLQQKINKISADFDISEEEKEKQIDELKTQIEEIKAEQEAYRKKTLYKLDEEGLTEEQIDQQKLSLINKIHAAGYLYHDHKFKHNSFIVQALDNSILEIGKNNGRSGKSIFVNNAIAAVKNTQYKDGKSLTKPNENTQFILGNIRKRHQTFIIDDANEYFPYGLLYNPVTGDLEVNPKNKSSFTIPFEYSCKIVMSCNNDYLDDYPSTKARAYKVLFSDYYHWENESIGDETLQPTDDLGHLLFDDFDDKGWNKYFNFMATALQFYLNHPKRINPPTENLEKRRLLNQITNNFDTWAKEYFNLENTNVKIRRSEVFDNYKDHADSSKMQPGKFKENLDVWCKSMGFVLNPPEQCNAELDENTGQKTKIVGAGYKMVNGEQKRTSFEMLYIQTNQKWNKDQKRLQDEIDGNNKEEEGFEYPEKNEFDPTEDITD